MSPADEACELLRILDVQPNRYDRKELRRIIRDIVSRLPAKEESARAASREEAQEAQEGQ